MLNIGWRRLLGLWQSHTAVTGTPQSQGSETAPLRLLLVANAMIPTLQLGLLMPLAKLIESGDCFVDFLTDQQLKERFGGSIRSAEARAWIEERWRTANPTYVVFCRYSGPHAETMLTLAKTSGVPSLYCIDDDLLHVPQELGKNKFEFHNHPLRLQAVRYLLDNVDLVYCSNSRLERRLREIGIVGNLHAGQIFCAGELMSLAKLRPARTIGYMGFDHAHDFEVALPGLVKVLHRFPDIRFELFGKIPKPPVLDEFGGRIAVLPAISDYGEFLKALAARRWDIGICPLVLTDFNRVKNVNKWIEYTAVGTAVVATKGLIYDECCANGCGLLVDDSEWEDALTTLVADPQRRFELVCEAQCRLIQHYSIEQLQKQIFCTLELAKDISKRNNIFLETENS